MSTRQDKMRIDELKGELKTAKKSYASGTRANDFRLLKLTLVMVILAIIAAIVHGRIQIY